MTLLMACAAPSSAELSAGMISFVFGLSANLANVSSCKIATNVGSGACCLIAAYTDAIA